MWRLADSACRGMPSPYEGVAELSHGLRHGLTK